MLEAMLIRYCSPTLAGLKTGALFSCPFADGAQMRACVRGWNARLRKKGLCVLPLRCHKERTLIYIYRSSALLRDLVSTQATQLLAELGYPCPCPERCIARLMDKLKQSPDFPHEIGLFLGYPVEDVRGFIRDPAACKYAGCWKVYGDAHAARALFARYRECTRLYGEQLALGASLEQLTAAG